MVLKSDWSNELLLEFKRKSIVGLELNYAKGWKHTDLSFLENLQDLKELLITHWAIEDVSKIHSLHNLKGLEVSTDCKSKIDFSVFPHLEEVSLEWRAKAKSIYQCRTLKKVFINHWPGKSLELFSELKDLEDLALYTPRLEEIGHVPFRKLKRLSIALCRKLDSLDGIELFQNLRELDIHGCKNINDISLSSKLLKLEKFYFNNNGHVKSLKPLEPLVNLCQFLFYESTNVEDGDLSVLTSLPKLTSAAFKERKHYNRSRSDFI